MKFSENKTYRALFPLFLTSLVSLWLSACGDDPVSCDNTEVDTDTTEIGPRMDIPESSFEFGYVPQYSTISHVFWLHSTGDDTLRIDSIKPG